MSKDPRVCKCGMKARVYFSDAWLCDVHAEELHELLLEQERAVFATRRSITEQMPSEPCYFCGHIDSWHTRSVESLVCVSCYNGLEGERRRIPQDDPVRQKRVEAQQIARAMEKRPEWLREIGRNCVRQTIEASRG